MLSTVHVLEDRSYVVIMKFESRGVEAEFRVTLSKRSERGSGFKRRISRHHLKPLERLDDEARIKVVRFCEDFAKSGKPATQG